MNAGDEDEAGPRFQVDARGGAGMQFGDGGIQYNHFTYHGTLFYGQAPPPLLGGPATYPYRGLSAFEEQDGPLFFGRDLATAELLNRMSHSLESGLLVVSGVSGAGKSSLVRAGMLPRLRLGGLESAPEAAR